MFCSFCYSWREGYGPTTEDEGSHRSKHKLPAEVQKMMLPKKVGNTWPSPSPASLFQSVASAPSHGLKHH